MRLSAAYAIPGRDQQSSGKKHMVQQDGFHAPANEEEEEVTEEGNELEGDIEEEGSAEEGEAKPEMVTVDGKEYEKSSPEYIKALESVNNRYPGAVSKMHEATQENAKLRENPNNEKPTEDIPSYRRPGWEPKTFGELKESLIEAEEVGMKKMEAANTASKNATEQAETMFKDWIVERQGSDKEFNESDFVAYVGKHKLTVNTLENLNSAYSVYSDRSVAVKAAEQNTKKNVATRGGDKVRAPGSGGGESKGPTWAQIRSAGGSAVEALRSFGGVK